MRNLLIFIFASYTCCAQNVTDIAGQQQNISIVATSGQIFSEKDTFLFKKSNNAHVFKGKVVDSKTNKAIPNTFVKALSLNAQVISDEDGIFIFNLANHYIDTVLVSSIGYKSDIYILKNNDSNIIKLTSLEYNLANVVVRGNKINPLDIITIVNHNIALNYHKSTYISSGYMARIFKDYNIIYNDVEAIVDIYYNVTRGKYMEVNFKEKIINNADSIIHHNMGINFMYFGQINAMDFINNNKIFDGNNYKRYKYKIINAYEDSSLGKLFLIQFIPKRLNYNLAFDYYADNMRGELLIRKEDFAVISAYYEVDRTVKRLRRHALKNHSRTDSSEIVLPNKNTITLYCYYDKDTVHNKYFLKMANYNYYKEGRTIDLSCPVSIQECLKYYRLGNVNLIDKANKTDMSQFKKFSEVDSHPEFWNNFYRPLFKNYFTNNYDR